MLSRRSRKSAARKSRRPAGRRQRLFERLEDRNLLSISTFLSGVSTPIPDQGMALSTIQVAESITIDDLDVTLDITHISDADLDVFLIGPDGTRVELFTDVGGGGDHFSSTTLDDEAATPITAGTAPFSGRFRPEGSLSTLDGKDAQGIWTLELTDDKRRKTGTLNSWSIDVMSAVPPVPVLSIDDVTMIEGDTAIRFIDVFVTPESGGLRNARGIEYGPDGNLYVSGESDPSDPVQLGFVNRYDGVTGAFIDVFASDPSMTGAKDVEFGSDGNLYVTNNVGSNVYRFDGTAGAVIDAFVPTGSGGLDTPRQLIFGPDGNGDGIEDLYVVSAVRDSILRYDGVTGGFLDAFVTAGSGELNEPTAITFGPDGSFYVASGAHQDFYNSILRYDGTSGDFLDIFVNAGSAGLTLAPTAGMLFGPDVNSDGTPDMYVSNGGGVDEVLIYSGADGSFLDKFITSGQGGLDDPKGLLFDNDGNLLAVNNGDHSVRRFGPASQAVFIVSLSSPSPLPVTVDYTTADGSAVAGSDYTAVSGTIIFAPGETSKTILVSTIDDVETESDETFVVNLTNATGASIADNQGVATIADDDNPASADDIYVGDIGFDSRLRGNGNRHDERIVLTVRNDADANEADGGDPGLAGASVSVEVSQSGGLLATLSGVTDASGVFTSTWLTNLPDGTYTATVTSISLGSFVWNTSLGTNVATHTIGHPFGTSAELTNEMLAALDAVFSSRTASFASGSSRSSRIVSEAELDLLAGV